MNSTANIVEKTRSQIGFEVDRVKIAEELLYVTPAKSYLEKDWEFPLIAFSHDNDF